MVELEKKSLIVEADYFTFLRITWITVNKTRITRLVDITHR